MANQAEPLVVSEPWDGDPHRFFYFNIGPRTYCGIKLPKHDSQASLGEYGSLITRGAILGPLIRSQTTETTVSIYHEGVSEQHRAQLFERLVSDDTIDIYHPFVRLSHGRYESSSESWDVSDEQAAVLDRGESHQRERSIELIRSCGVNNPLIFDPACSTGRFLREIKAVFPQSQVVGQDISKWMCERAARSLDQVILGDAIQPGVPDGSCDFVFCRFLNAEVIATAEAEERFIRLGRCLNQTGLMVLFGHSPVLIAKPRMEILGFEVLGCHAYDNTTDSIFQYYVLRKRQAD